jgi:hypothetical protein
MRFGPPADDIRDLSSLQDTDEIMSVILNACFEADDICPLAEYGDVDSVITALNEVLENWQPIPHFQDPRYTMYVADVKQQLVRPMYDPNEYYAWAETIRKLLELPAEEVFAAAKGDAEAEPEPPAGPIPEKWQQSEDSLYAIRCGDWPRRMDDVSELEALIPELDHGYFPDASAADWTACYRWPFYAKEQYTGGFEIETANPILFVNPSWDPVTVSYLSSEQLASSFALEIIRLTSLLHQQPLGSAKNASSTMEGSVVLEHRAPGHGSMGLASKCTMQYMRDYMVDGTLPEKDTVCEPDMDIFFKSENPLVTQLMRQTVWQDLVDDANAADLRKIAEEQEAAAGGNGTANGTAEGTEADGEQNAASAAGASLLVIIGLVAGLMALL